MADGQRLLRIGELASRGGARVSALRRFPQLDQTIARLQHLRQVVADCLACGCMSLTSCVLLAEQPHAAAEP